MLLTDIKHRADSLPQQGYLLVVKMLQNHWRPAFTPGHSEGWLTLLPSLSEGRKGRKGADVP